MSEHKAEVKRTGGYSSISVAVLIAFFLFYVWGGWYRIDCALGTQAACDLIVAEYAKEAKP